MKKQFAKIKQNPVKNTTKMEYFCGINDNRHDKSFETHRNVEIP